MATQFAEISAAAGISEEVTQRLVALEGGTDQLGVNIDTVLKIPVVNGKGAYSSPTVPSFWATATGTATIVSPTNGTWAIKVVDTVAGKTIFDEPYVPQGKAVPFKYKTGFRAQIEATAEWSDGGSTTLEVRIVGSL